MTAFAQVVALIKANPAWATLTDDQVAVAIQAISVPAPTIPVFGSFRTLAYILDPTTEYDVLRAALKAAITQEQTAGGTYISDMSNMLTIPGPVDGSGGGLDLSAPSFISQLTTICTAANLPNVVSKIAAYVASFQSAPGHPYADVGGGTVNSARAYIAQGN